ncbi:MAG: hypothetical protein JST90_11740 [Bacteroidetes bacterium]|nr:hypothetical protein [Bacteroidota bacterium]
MGLKNTLFMNCAEATAVVEKKRDGKLSLAERFGVWLHLVYCKLCKAFFDQSAILDRSYHHLAERVNDGQQSYTLDPSRKEQMKNALQEEMQK